MNNRLTDKNYAHRTTTVHVPRMSGFCVAQATVNDTQTIATVTTTPINYMSVTYDPWSSITTGAAWKFTVPLGKSGWFHFNGGIRLNSAAWTVNQFAVFDALVNATTAKRMQAMRAQAANTFEVNLLGETTMYLAEDDYVQFTGYHDNAGTLTVPNITYSVYIDIFRIGPNG